MDDPAFASISVHTVAYTAVFSALARTTARTENCILLVFASPAPCIVYMHIDAQ